MIPWRTTLASFLDKWLQKKPKRAKGGKSSTMAKRRDEEAYAERGERPGRRNSMSSPRYWTPRIFSPLLRHQDGGEEEEEEEEGRRGQGPRGFGRVGRRVGRRRRDCRAEEEESRQGWTRGVRAPHGRTARPRTSISALELPDSEDEDEDDDEGGGGGKASSRRLKSRCLDAKEAGFGGGDDDAVDRTRGNVRRAQGGGGCDGMRFN